MKRQILITLILATSILSSYSQDIFMKYQRGYQAGSLGSFIINGAFDINTPDNSSLWSDYPVGIGYATLNNFRGDKMFTQLLSNADNNNFWIRTSNYVDGTPSATGNTWNKIWHSGNLNNTSTDIIGRNITGYKYEAPFTDATPAIYAYNGNYNGGNSVALRTNVEQPHHYVFQGQRSGTTNSYILGSGDAYFAGAIGIGTTSPAYKLDVAGTIRACEVKVDLNSGECPDYVFSDNYDLMSLESLEKYVNENKHLPKIEPSNIMESDGLNLKDINIKLLEKMEEMSLYMIDMNKRVKSLERENELLKEKLESVIK